MDDPAEPKVQEEWQRLQKQRLEEERAEALEDAERATREPPPRRRIPWTWLAVALVAGIAAAVVINSLLVPSRGPAP